MLRKTIIVVALCFLTCWFLPALAQQDNTSSPQSQDQKDQKEDQKEQQSARDAEESSSKDTRIDLTPPADDAKKHPQSGAAVSDADDEANDVQELQAWDPHKAAKDIEVGDFYYKRKNYRAALDRYKEALVYKPNDAIANFRLGECEEKVGHSKDAESHYQAYLKILPHGPFAADAQKALERLKDRDAKVTGPK